MALSICKEIPAPTFMWNTNVCCKTAENFIYMCVSDCVKSCNSKTWRQEWIHLYNQPFTLKTKWFWELFPREKNNTGEMQRNTDTICQITGCTNAILKEQVLKLSFSAICGPLSKQKFMVLSPQGKKTPETFKLNGHENDEARNRPAKSLQLH